MDEASDRNCLKLRARDPLEVFRIWVYGSEFAWIQDQIDFEQRRSRGGPVPTVADHQGGDNSAGDDGNLYSDQATMMTEEARTLILAGDTVAGLEAYKKRMYRKMQAHAPEEVSRSTPCGSCEPGQLLHA